MKLDFKYNLEKDAENFLKSFNSVNSKKPTKLQELYLAEIGEIDQIKVLQFLSGQSGDVNNKLAAIESSWRKIEDSLLERMDELFGLQLPQTISVYLSLNARCTYNISENYFFVYVNGKNTNSSIAHELLHFYTWHVLCEDLMKKGISSQEYNDIKESLTELLNTDFSDLLGNEGDSGYPQHQEMRMKIRQMRIEGSSLREIIQNLIKK